MKKGAVLFALTMAITTPFPYTGFKFMSFWNVLFEPCYKSIGVNIFGLPEGYTYSVNSDSTGLYIHLVVCLLLSIFLMLLLGKRMQFLSNLAVPFTAYFIALHFFLYGFNKVFAWQFPFPESNLLYTEVGNLSKDLLYWTSMGTSKTYTVFIGVLEIIAALLLVVRRTRFIGSLVAFGILLNIVFVNFGFDINVKVHSLFLLFLSLLLLSGFSNHLLSLLGMELPSHTGSPHIPKRLKSTLLVKSMVIALMVGISVYPFLESKLNQTEPNPWIGGYELLDENELGIEKLFIHSKYFIIFEFKNGERKSLKFNQNSPNELSFNNHFLVFTNKNNGSVYIAGSLFSINVNWLARQMNSDDLPIVQRGFHWSVDGY